jgi:hypothetical protein
MWHPLTWLCVVGAFAAICLLVCIVKSTIHARVPTQCMLDFTRARSLLHVRPVKQNVRECNFTQSDLA